MTDEDLPKVMIVEDDDGLREVVEELLRDEGFAAVGTSNGQEALDYLLATSRIPSLVLLDLNMPVMSGREMIRVLRGHERLMAIPIVLVTSEPLRTGSLEEGTVGQLQKPYSSKALIALVRKHAATPSDHDNIARTSGSRLPPAAE